MDGLWKPEGADFNRSRENKNFQNMFGNSSPDYLPFEFWSFEFADDASCTFSDSQAPKLEIEAYLLLDEHTSQISTLNLERVRRPRSSRIALTKSVQKVINEIEQLMYDDGDMAEIYLTDKKLIIESSFNGEKPVLGYRSNDGAMSISTPVSTVSSPPAHKKFENSLSFERIQHESSKSTYIFGESIKDLEMLLEAYFVVIDRTLNKLTSLKEYIKDTRDLYQHSA